MVQSYDYAHNNENLNNKSKIKLNPLKYKNTTVISVENKNYKNETHSNIINFR